MPRFADRRFVATDEFESAKPRKSLAQQVADIVHKADEIVEKVQIGAEAIAPKVADIIEAVEEVIEEVVDVVKDAPAPAATVRPPVQFDKNNKSNKFKRK